MNRILITGASGFIGQRVVLALRGSGYEIHTIHNSARQMTDSRNHQLDLMNPQAVDRLMERVQPTHLMHLAWYAEHGKFWTSPLNLDWVTASLHLFRSFVNNGGQRAVFAGSCAEYDWSHSPLNEETSPSNPGTLYGVCKNSLRQMIEKFAQQSSVSVAWGRIFFLYGRGEHPNRLIPSILQPLLSDKQAVVRSGAHVRNLMHVEDVAAAFTAILKSPLNGIVNVADEPPISLGDVARMIGDLTGKTNLLHIEHAEGTRDNPIMLTADTARLRSIGFTPRFSLREGLVSLIDAKEPA
jgi:nucleoside-diphosphate-sugar epimerase